MTYIWRVLVSMDEYTEQRQQPGVVEIKEGIGKLQQVPLRLYSIGRMPGVLQQVHLPLFHIHHFQSSQQGMSFTLQIFDPSFFKLSGPLILNNRQLKSFLLEESQLYFFFLTFVAHKCIQVKSLGKLGIKQHPCFVMVIFYF